MIGYMVGVDRVKGLNSTSSLHMVENGGDPTKAKNGEQIMFSFLYCVNQ